MTTLGSRYVQLLQGQPDPNNGTIYGGLASALQKGMMGYAMGQDRAEEEAKQGRLTQALQMMAGTPDNTITWNQPTRPDGTGDPTTTIPGQAPDRQGAIGLLLQDNPDLALQLMNSDYNFNRQQEAAAAQAGNELVTVVRNGVKVAIPRSQMQPGEQVDYTPTPEAPEIRPQMLPDDMVQDLQFNPLTGEYDIPVGDPYPRWRPEQGPQPQMVEGLDGRQYWATGPNAGQLVLPNEQSGQTPPFEGTGMEAQTANILLTGDPSSQAYAVAYAALGKERYSYNPTTQETTIIKPDMSMFAPPTFQLPTGGVPDTNATVVPPLDGSGQLLAPGTPADDRRAGLTVVTPDTLPPVDQRAYAAGITIIGRVSGALNAYRDLLVNDEGIKDRADLLMPGNSSRAKITAARTDLMMEMKELFDLGVLTGPDMDLLTAIVADPTSFNPSSEGIWMGAEGYNAQFDVIENKLATARKLLDEQFGITPQAEAPPAPTNPSEREVGKVYMSPNGALGKWTGLGWEIQ
jgi:hypothetical protein